MDKTVRGIKLHLKRKAQKEKIKNAFDRCFNKIDHILSPEGRQEFAEKERLLRERKAFNIKNYVKSLYGRR